MIGVVTWTLELSPEWGHVPWAGVGCGPCCDVGGGDDGLDSSIHWASGGHPPTVAQIGEGDCREMISIDGTVWPKQGGRCAASPKTAHPTEVDWSTAPKGRGSPLIFGGIHRPVRRPRRCIPCRFATGRSRTGSPRRRGDAGREPNRGLPPLGLPRSNGSRRRDSGFRQRAP